MVTLEFRGLCSFYAPLTFAAAYGPGWLVSGTWQLTIVAGVLLAPLFVTVVDNKIIRQKIPLTSLFISSIILIGIMLIQIPQGKEVTFNHLLLGVIPVVIAAFSYPLGNRKMMELCGSRIDAFERVLGMTIASLPAWIILAVIAICTVGLPSMNQVIQSFIVAVSSGVIATTLFFIATDRVRDHQGKLAAVEATQSMEVVFVIIGEMMILGVPLPDPIALFGLAIIIVGMLLHSYHTAIIGKNQTYQKKPNFSNDVWLSPSISSPNKICKNMLC